MRMPSLTFLLAVVFTGALAQQLPHDDEVRVAEGVRLAHEIQDKVWPDWSQAPFSVLLVTSEGEFLINHPRKPAGFRDAGHSKRLDSHVYVRPRNFPVNFQATFPAAGDGVPAIVTGEPENTESKTSTPWVITLMHEHFHQLQYSQPGYQEGVAQLGLARGDNTGMWMLNFPFPYDFASVTSGFDRMKHLLLDALRETDRPKFESKVKAYVAARKSFLESLKQDDRRYFQFQVWQEGIARYTQIKVAEAAADHQVSADFRSLKDYESFADYAKHARADTENELEQADIAKWQRVVFYSYGACEGLLLDNIDAKWQSRYFRDRFSTDSYFSK